MSLTKIAEISRRYGSDENFVLAGGGNTSFKDENYLYIKASGFSLGSITEDGFAKMERCKLNAIWQKSYPADKDAREKDALEDLMAARVPGETKRPSVETLLHALFPQTYVVHMHPALVNGLTCAKDGEKLTSELFGKTTATHGSTLWIPTVNPGYILAKTIKDLIDQHMARGNAFPSVLFLQNHGVFAASDDPAAIDDIYRHIFDTLGKRVKRRADLADIPAKAAEFKERIARFQILLKEELSCGHTAFIVNKELLGLCESPETMAPIMSAYTPDHIVYAGHSPLFVPFARDEKAQRAVLVRELAAYKKRWNVAPKTVVLQKTGAFSCQPTAKSADTALVVFNDALKVAAFTESFGGRLFMPREQIDFILTWEVEQYRAKVNAT